MRRFAEQVIAWWDRDRNRVFKMRTEYAQGSGPMIWTYATHTVELMRAVIDASERSRMTTAIPQVRLMIELAMTSIWLYLLPAEAAKALVHETIRQQRATVRDAIAAGYTESEYDEILARLDTEKAEHEEDKSPAGKSFEQRCRAIEGGLGMYVMWRLLSRMSHAGGNVADHYLIATQVDDQNPLGVVFNPNPDDDAHESTLGIAVCMLLAALKVCDLVDGEGRRKTQLRKAAKRIGIALEFNLAAPAAT